MVRVPTTSPYSSMTKAMNIDSDWRMLSAFSTEAVRGI